MDKAQEFVFSFMLVIDIPSPSTPPPTTHITSERIAIKWYFIYLKQTQIHCFSA